MTHTIKIGIIHSLSGTMKLNEVPMVQAIEMAVHEINQSGGVLGQQIEAIVKDCKSIPEEYASQAETLLTKNDVACVFGCWTSASRKAVKPIIERHQSLLWYPLQYEGLEEAPCIIYTGSCFNQQILPGVKWALSRGFNRCVLVGSDYVFPRTSNRLISLFVKNDKGTVLGEEYIPLGSTNVSNLIDMIIECKPDIIFNTLNGDSNLVFFKKLYQAGIGPEVIPIMSFSLSEIESLSIAEEVKGSYACWNYFSTIPDDENQRFVKKCKEYLGPHYPISDPVVTSYSQVYLWKQLVERCKTFDCEVLSEHLIGTFFNGPSGMIQIQKNHHVGRYARIGRAREDGLFDIIWTSPSPLPPLPWLGMEEIAISNRSLILEVMKEFPELGHQNWNLRRTNPDHTMVGEEPAHTTCHIHTMDEKNVSTKNLQIICAVCKSLFKENGEWQSVEAYLSSTHHTKLSHSLCNLCEKVLYPWVEPEPSSEED
ncbi:MAG: urea ABC transporter substrate-binding protein [Nitrospirales bacterium]|nr:urea ABC transporter substrate-binding protein [Nitrospira sp.]MDR4502591.1 urea ABC transporter substrate-binding protein [Nitrospirales bacterium]